MSRPIRVGYLLAVLYGSAAVVAADDYQPVIFGASEEPQQAISRFQVPADMTASVFAAEPLLANPVAFCFDDQGRAYVCETFRHHAGVTDTRYHMDWLDDDLACRTVADRVAMYRKHLKDRFETYGIEHDRVRRIVDRDGDGVADAATVFADGFRDHAAGIGAGVLARDGKVWFACIPHLWLLEDSSGDGVADRRKSLHDGFGVHVGFLGHDLHGLCMGPDGRIYFSIGDRGFHVVTDDGVLDYPDTGAVLRCEPDGSKLEVFASGLRNPQELAFDDFGNLFTGDNNSDAGDQARWVYLVDGGDSGWRIGFQFLTSPTPRGPWNAERMWQPEQPKHADHPRRCFSILPPLANLGAGPSGLAYYPGTGLDDRYRGHFFLCDFRGGQGASGIHAFNLRPQGAAFAVDRVEPFIWRVLATDVDFGPDGALYFSDWVDGWAKTGKGRLYKVAKSQPTTDGVSAQVAELLAKGLRQHSDAQCVELLGHADQRIRQRAQFELVARGPDRAALLRQTAEDVQRPILSRVHALWGLGQLARRNPALLSEATALFTDPDAEIRSQTAKVFGDAGAESGRPMLMGLLADESPRVRLHAALALARMGKSADILPVLTMLGDNADQDAYLRHAGVMALAAMCEEEQLVAHAADPSASVRMGVLLALRRHRSPEVARFLDDTEPQLVLEAARAIHDEPIPAAMAALARTLDRSGMDEIVLRRAINANFRLGEAEHAQRVAAFAGNPDADVGLRGLALTALADWSNPSGRDLVVGLWRPLPPRPPEIVAAAIEPVLPDLLRSDSPTIRLTALKVAGRLALPSTAEALRDAYDNATSAEQKVEALLAMEQLGDAVVETRVSAAVADSDPRVRRQGQRLLPRIDPAAAGKLLRQVVEEGTTPERQGALTTLATMPGEEIDAVFVDWLQRLAKGGVPPELHLELLEAAASRPNENIQRMLSEYQASRAANADPLARYSESLAGGDAQAGRKLFVERTDLSCLRCHKINDQGGEVGPNLSKIGAQKDRQYLLESIVDPNRKIAEGFDTVVVADIDGGVHVGVLRFENERELLLVNADGKLITLAKDQIDERSRGKSAMPEDIIKQLDRRQLRDLIEYLASLRF